MANTYYAVKEDLMRVEAMLKEAHSEHEWRTSQLQHLDQLIVNIRTAANGADERVEQVTPVMQKTRRVVLAPHPSPLTGTPMRECAKPVQSMHCRSKWTSPFDSACGASARPSFSAADLQAARQEAWAERMAGMPPGACGTNE